MSPKHDLLSQNDAEEVTLSPFVYDILSYLVEGQRDKSLIRILDLGCGRGATVFNLRQSGFCAFGLEVDSSVVSQSVQLFSEYGFDHSRLLRVATPGERWPFEDSFFDVVISDQVFEHVGPLDEVLKELTRVTRLGGIGFHRYPARWIKIEPHVFVPYVHWLPKWSWLRRLWLLSYYPRLPKWHGQNEMSKDQRLHQFLDYLQFKTYYRSLYYVVSSLRACGHYVRLSDNHRSPKGLPARLKSQLRKLRRSSFESVELVTIKTMYSIALIP